MKIHGQCRWCHHRTSDHKGKSSKDPVQVEMPKIKWLKSACSKYGCPCRRYEV